MSYKTDTGLDSPTCTEDRSPNLSETVMNWHGELCPVHIGIIRDPSVYFQWFNIQNDNIHTAPVDVVSQARDSPKYRR